MNILIINHNGGSIYHGPNLRTYYAAKELVKQGHDVTITSSSYSHKYSVLPEVKGVVTPEVIDGVKYRWIKCVKYKRLFERIYSHFEFGCKLIFNRKKVVKKLDLVIFSGPPPEVFIFAWIMSRIYKVPIISDIRDHWPLTQIEMSRLQWLNPYVYFLFLCQFLMIHGSKRLVSPLPGSNLYLSKKGAKEEVVIIENGYDTDRIYDNNLSSLELEVVSNSIGLKNGTIITPESILSLNRFVIGYSGAFDRDNDLDSLISAAKELSKHDNILFLFMGAGLRLEKLKEATNSVGNILVINRVLSIDVPKVLSVMNVCYCGLKPKNIYQYGVSLAKSYEYMAAKKPIIWSIEAYNNPVKESGGGFLVKPGNISELIDAISKCIELSEEELISIGEKGANYLENNYSYKFLGDRWNDLVETAGKKI